MHEVITNIPEYVELARQRAQLQQRADEHRRRTIAASEEYQRKLRENMAARREALLAGEEPPPEPTRPTSNPSDAAAFIGEGQRIEAAMAAVLAEHLDSIEGQAAGREAELLAEAAKQVRLLDSIGAELKELASGVRMARNAAGVRERVESGNLDAAGVARLVAEGGSVLDPDPTTGGTTYSAIQVRDHDEDAAYFDMDAPRGSQGMPKRRSRFHRR